MGHMCDQALNIALIFNIINKVFLAANCTNVNNIIVSGAKCYHQKLTLLHVVLTGMSPCKICLWHFTQLTHKT